MCGRPILEAEPEGLYIIRETRKKKGRRKQDLRVTSRVGEMAQQLRALAALPEDQGSSPVPMWQLATICKSSSRGSGILIQTYR